MDIDISEKYLTTIQTAIAETMVGVPCTVYLFGSRAIGRARTTSDVDIAVQAGTDISIQLSRLRETLEQSNIPYVIDLVDLNTTATPFAAQVKEKGLVLWTN